MKSNPYNYDDREHIRIGALIIENSLESFGILSKVVEINIKKKFYEYCLALAMGTDLKALEKHDKDLAMVLASPTGKVYWQIPVPGETYVKLRVPKPSVAYLERRKAEKEAWKKQNNLKTKIAFFFYMLGEINFSIARIILGKDY